MRKINTDNAKYFRDVIQGFFGEHQWDFDQFPARCKKCSITIAEAARDKHRTCNQRVMDEAIS